MRIHCDEAALEKKQFMFMENRKNRKAVRDYY